jgi:hypothetical protein
MGRLSKEQERTYSSRSFCAACARPRLASGSTCAPAMCSQTPMSSTLTRGKPRDTTTTAVLTVTNKGREVFPSALTGSIATWGYIQGRPSPLKYPIEGCAWQRIS